MRGVIMETKNGRAVLLTKDGNFVDIKNKGYQVGDKVNITPNTGRLCAMAASLLVMCAGIGSYFVPAGYVSVDINPSLMMTLNPYNRVIDIQTFNDDARILLNRTDIKGKGAEESIEMLIRASEEIGYINDNNRDVILEIVPGMIKPDMGRIRHGNIELTNEMADRETLRMAQNIGVSMAKVKAIEEYTEKNGGDIRSNAAKFNDKSAKEVRAIMRDGHLPDKKPPEIPIQNPIPAPRPPKPQISGASNVKPSYSIKTDVFSVIEQKNEKNISDNRPLQNDYRPPENIPFSMEHLPPIPNEMPRSELVPIDNHMQDNNVPPKKTINKPEQEFQPIHTEPKPQDRRQPDGGGNHEFSKPAEPVHEGDVPPVNKQPSEDEKMQDVGTEQNESKKEDNNSEISEKNPNDETEDLTDNPQTEKQPDISEPAADKPQNNPSEPKFDEPPQNNTQPGEPRHEDTPSQNNPQMSKPRDDAPPHGEPQNNGSNPPPDENMGGHNEHKEIQ